MVSRKALHGSPNPNALVITIFWHMLGMKHWEGNQSFDRIEHAFLKCKVQTPECCPWQ